MRLCLYYNETVQNQRASVWQWDAPESKSLYITMNQSRIKEHPVISCCLLTSYSKSYKRKTNDNPMHTSTCHAIPNLYLFARLLIRIMPITNCYSWARGVWNTIRVQPIHSSTVSVLVHAVQITTGPQYLTSSVSSSSSLITGLALERDFLFLELSDFSFFYNIQYIFTCITKHCLIQVVKGTKVWIIKSKIRIIQETIPFWTFLFCVSCW